MAYELMFTLVILFYFSYPIKKENEAEGIKRKKVVSGFLGDKDV